MLKKLLAAVHRYEAEIAQALAANLGKSDFEGFMCEIGMVRSEISYMLRHIRRYAKEKRVPTPMAQFASRSYVQPSPYGNVLIMSPWNYPFLLTLDPLVDAIAAGNTAVVKPSAYSPATGAVLEKIIRECFEPPVCGGDAGGNLWPGAAGTDLSEPEGSVCRAGPETQAFGTLHFLGEQTGDPGCDPALPVWRWLCQ